MEKIGFKIKYIQDHVSDTEMKGLSWVMASGFAMFDIVLLIVAGNFLEFSFQNAESSVIMIGVVAVLCVINYFPWFFLKAHKSSFRRKIILQALKSLGENEKPEDLLSDFLSLRQKGWEISEGIIEITERGNIREMENFAMEMEDWECGIMRE